jgi:replicative DNA helicase
MGKAQPLDAKVLTTRGFKPMAELSIGDELASVDGAPSHVVGVYPQGERQVYRITLSDGRSTECCAEHLWKIYCDGYRIVATAEVMQLMQKAAVEIEVFAHELPTLRSAPLERTLSRNTAWAADASIVALMGEDESSHARTCSMSLDRVEIAAIVPTRVTQTQCIAVDHDSHLYITDDFIVTHNTAFAMNIIEHVSADSLLPCAVFSLEMSKQQLAQRMLCSRGQIDAHKLRKGMLQAHEYAHLANVVGELAKAPIWVDDSPGLTPLELRAKARRLKLQHDIKLIMIDYMQLMDNPGVESRQQQISEISRGIKAVARELNVPVIALSQLNRASEGRDGHRPRMSDLRESGSIEQDADVIALLHREDYYRMSEPDFQPDNIAEIIIAKQRNGPTGTVKLTFMNKTTRFENLSTHADPF